MKVTFVRVGDMNMILREKEEFRFLPGDQRDDTVIISTHCKFRQSRF